MCQYFFIDIAWVMFQLLIFSTTHVCNSNVKICRGTIEPRKSCKPSIFSKGDINAAQSLLPVLHLRSPRPIVTNTIYTRTNSMQWLESMLQRMVLLVRQSIILQFGNPNKARRLKEKYLEKLKEKIADQRRKLHDTADSEKHKKFPSLFLNWKRSFEVGQYA